MMDELIQAKTFIGGAAALLTLISYIPYYRGLRSGVIHPHAFSWFIWFLTMTIAFLAQLSEGAGPGAWKVGIDAVINLIVAIIAIRQGKISATRGDWVSLIIALSAIPVWIVTKNPLWAVVIVSVIDIVGFYPTFRKSWDNPYNEGALTFAILAIACVLSIMALNSYVVTNWLYQVSMFIVYSALAVFLVLRRRQVRKEKTYAA